MEEVTLIKVSAEANNNKFYRVTFDGSSITTTWGRVGSEGTSTTSPGGEAAFKSIVQKKLKRGYRKTDVQSGKRGPSDKGVLQEVAKATLAKNSQDPILASALTHMVDSNRHQIIKASGGLLEASDDGVVRTPLGIVSEASLTEAAKLLRKVEETEQERARAALTADYLSLIPQKVKGRDWPTTFFAKDEQVVAQQELLRQLRSSLQWHEAQGKAQEEQVDITQFQDLFPLTIARVEEQKRFQELDELYRRGINQRHSSRNFKLAHAYELTYRPQVNEEFEKLEADLGNKKLLWHGTDAGNLLSILREGLFVPPMGSAAFRTSGRMFGQGVYFSDQSTKSLNYAQGYWKGGSTRRCFMFLAEVVMGNEYWPNRSPRWSTQEAYSGKNSEGRKFDSISVKGGTCGVLNNEMIVWNTKQIRLKYLLEFTA